MKKIIPIVICGGSGSRLWPKSRVAMPKPFITLPGTGTSLLNDTYARLNAMPTPPAAVVTIAAKEHFNLCQDCHTRAFPQSEHFFIGEPLKRNTAPAIAVAAEFVRRRFGDDAILLVLPADHAINDKDAFYRAINIAADAAAAGYLSLLGVPPDHPATGYGYIEQDTKLKENLFNVRRFVEKPDMSTAQEFLQAKNFLWNAGIFCFKMSTLAEELRTHAADIADLQQEVFAQTDDSANVFFPPAEVYQRFPDISFDYALMENTDKAAVVVATDMQWRDVGSWRAVAANFPADDNGNRTDGDVVFKASADNFVIADERLIACIGVRGLHIIDSPDALLVAAAEQSDKTREVFDRLLADERKEAAVSTTDKRPWGYYTVISEGAGYKVKRIAVSPGGCLSLQSHEHRNEQWTTVEGVMTVVIDEKTFDMAVGQSCHIPPQARHRMLNKTDKPAAVIEVQTGDNLSEDDITRYEDIYGRA